MIAAAADRELLLRDLARRAAGERVDSLVELPPGGNSRLWKAVTASGRPLLVKRYATRGGDARLRLAREFAALGFLWARGVRCIPEPLLADPEEAAGVCAFLEGAPLRPGEVTPADADAALAFLVLLGELSRDPAAAALGPASEAVLAPGAYLGVIERRRGALASAGDGDLERFLREELAPLARAAEFFARGEADRRRVSWDREAEPGRRTLSPSDFGFHNALRAGDGTLRFVDFEYFGWDDPAKLLADFFHQPAVPLPAGLRPRVLGGLERGLPGGETLADRLAVLYPLAGVNWCLIMLNPFRSPEGGDPRAAQARRERLAAARAKARSLGEELRERAFPLGGRP